MEDSNANGADRGTNIGYSPLLGAREENTDNTRTTGSMGLTTISPSVARRVAAKAKDYSNAVGFMSLITLELRARCRKEWIK